MDLSQSQLAPQIGASISAISRWERHCNAPSRPRVLRRLWELSRMMQNLDLRDRVTRDGRRVAVNFALHGSGRFASPVPAHTFGFGR